MVPLMNEAVWKGREGKKTTRLWARFFRRTDTDAIRGKNLCLIWKLICWCAPSLHTRKVYHYLILMASNTVRDPF